MHTPLYVQHAGSERSPGDVGSVRVPGLGLLQQTIQLSQEEARVLRVRRFAIQRFSQLAVHVLEVPCHFVRWPEPGVELHPAQVSRHSQPGAVQGIEVQIHYADEGGRAGIVCPW